jgi:hypothetical protein
MSIFSGIRSEDDEGSRTSGKRRAAAKRALSTLPEIPLGWPLTNLQKEGADEAAKQRDLQAIY